MGQVYLEVKRFLIDSNLEEMKLGRVYDHYQRSTFAMLTSERTLDDIIAELKQDTKLVRQAPRNELAAESYWKTKAKAVNNQRFSELKSILKTLHLVGLSKEELNDPNIGRYGIDALMKGTYDHSYEKSIFVVRPELGNTKVARKQREEQVFNILQTPPEKRTPEEQDIIHEEELEDERFAKIMTNLGKKFKQKTVLLSLKTSPDTVLVATTAHRHWNDIDQQEGDIPERYSKLKSNKDEIASTAVRKKPNNEIGFTLKGDTSQGISKQGYRLGGIKKGYAPSLTPEVDLVSTYSQTNT